MSNNSSSYSYESRYNIISREIHNNVGGDVIPDNFHLLPPSGNLESENSQNSRTLKAHILNENDKAIFDELKAFISEGDWESLLVKLIEHPDFRVDSQDSADRNFTLLHFASQKKRVECIRVLINDMMANPNIKADMALTPMHLLVLSDCRCKSCLEKLIQCLSILVEGGAHVDAENSAGETPLYSCARNKLTQAASFLLSNGANINHWMSSGSVATLLAQYVPDVLKAEFDKRIIPIKDELGLEGVQGGLRLDFRLLLQEPAIHEGFRTRNLPREQRGKVILGSLRHEHVHDSLLQPHTKNQENDIEGKTKRHERKPRESEVDKVYSSYPSLSSSLTSHASTSPSVAPAETELLNYLLKADLTSIEAILNHPLVEAFVHLKWLSVRKLFFALRSLYFLFISFYTFYVFDTFVNATCFYNEATPAGTNVKLGRSDGAINTSDHANYARKGEDSSNEGTIEKATFGFFIPTASAGSGETRNFTEHQKLYYFHSFSEYFKAHEMTCELSIRNVIMAYLFSVFVVGIVIYEVYKLYRNRYDYFKQPQNLGWWLLTFSVGLTVVPGLGLYAHTWLYPMAAITLVYGWSFFLVQVARIPYFGIFIGIFSKVMKEFCVLLLTFSPLLLAFALGFSVLLPQNEFFRFIPVAVFKVFLMMTGDVDFWGVFKGTWTEAQHQGHVYIPLFIIYTVFVLMVTLVLNGLLLGIAIDNIQQVRHEAALFRTVRLIEEIGIFEDFLQNPVYYYGGCSEFLRRVFSISSLKYMNGPELITFPENVLDETLPLEIKQKLVSYLGSSCCCSDDGHYTHDLGHPSPVPDGEKVKRRRKFQRNPWNDRDEKIRQKERRQSNLEVNAKISVEKKKIKEDIRRKFFEDEGLLPLSQPTQTNTEDNEENETKDGRDLILYHEIKLLLEDNNKLKERLESLKRNLLKR